MARTLIRSPAERRGKEAPLTPSQQHRLAAQDVKVRLTFEYLTFDLWHNARPFTKWLNAHEIISVSTLKSNALITYRGRTQPVADWAQQLPRRRIAGRT